MRNLIVIALALICLTNELIAQSEGKNRSYHLFEIEAIDENAALVQKYECKLSESKTEDLSTITLYPGLSISKLPFNRYSFYEQSVAALLLKNGLGEIRSDKLGSAPEELVRAQAEAAKTRVENENEESAQSNRDEEGESSDRTSGDSSETTPDKEDSTSGGIAGYLKENVPGYVWKVIAACSVLGFPAFKMINFVFRKFCIEKRINMVIIGEKAAGKTGLLLRLQQPRVSEERIMGLSPTQILKPTDLEKPIPYTGRFQIFPKLLDVPGAKYGIAIDSLIRQPDVVAVVLAHTHMKDSKEIDAMKLAEQLEYVKILIGGVLDSRRIKNPRLIILFISKFDILCQHPPWDSSAKGEVDRLKRTFKDHIQEIENAARRQKVPFRLLVGSAVKGWNCEQLKTNIAEVLF